MKPEDVQPKNFAPFKALYTDDEEEFSIAWGTWTAGEKPCRCLAMRWNGDMQDPDAHGYPVQGKYPLWFTLPDNLGYLIMKALSGTSDKSVKKFIAKEELKAALSELGLTRGHI
jgi:hypothetical protein